MNGYQQEGVGHMDSTCHKGERWSAASAYLRPVLQRKVVGLWCTDSSAFFFVFLESDHNEWCSGY